MKSSEYIYNTYIVHKYKNNTYIYVSKHVTYLLPELNSVQRPAKISSSEDSKIGFFFREHWGLKTIAG